ncbi:ATP-binding protein [Paeniglutamicibacter sp. MACA_103]|uniref:ATP-binding protein n=1 Tax=Paeniglutamicibacter sp. MACA_103 TaxID=3377337 RepID=UPI003894478D
MVALIGGGSGIPRPGAASRAHRGLLFLDEVRVRETPHNVLSVPKPQVALG